MPSMVILKREVLGDQRTDRYIGLNDEEMNDVVGRVLTAIEVAMPEGGQLTALKSVVKQEIWRTFNGATGDWMSLEAGKFDKETGQYDISGKLGYPKN